MITRRVECYICVFFSVIIANQGLNIFNKFYKRNEEQKMASVAALVEAGFRQCKSVKNLNDVLIKQKPDTSSVNLQYWHNNTYRDSYNMSYAAEAYTKSKFFKQGRTLYIYCHGYLFSPKSDDFQSIRKALYNRGEYNVLALNSSVLLHQDYFKAFIAVPYIGELLGQVLAEMVERGVKTSSIRLIGHSLGAHISGFAGKTFRNLTGKSIRRISGLDPARPCFERVRPEKRLDVADADFVDIIHTNSRFYGINIPIGDMDYYPNSGYRQPGCGFGVSDLCSHLRSWEYYAESIQDPTSFPSVMCSDWNTFQEGKCGNMSESFHTSYMGFASTLSAPGFYYLQTNDSKPYGLGKRGLVYHDQMFI